MTSMAEVEMEWGKKKKKKPVFTATNCLKLHNTLNLYSIFFDLCKKNIYFPLQPLKNNKYRIFKSRYDSIDSYLSSCGEKYNDIDLTIDEEIYKQLLGRGAFI